MSIKAGLKAKDMTGLLRAHYLPEGRPAGGIFASEIGSPDGRRFADAIWQSTTRSGGLLFIGHEIKVSRADVAVELADPTKAEPWMQYCDQWWLTVSDPALVEGFDIPEAWGVMSPPSGRRKRSMTIIKEAPLLKPVSKEPGLLRLLTWYANRQKEERNEIALEKYALENKVRNLEYEVQNAKAGSPMSWEERFVADVYARFNQRMKDENIQKSYFGQDTDKNDFVDALIDMEKFRSRGKTLEYSAKQAMNAMDSLERALADARKVAKEIKAEAEKP
jgi:hypothetical protein